MSAFGRLICNLRGHVYAGTQTAPHMHHPVPTHCQRCDWTQGPWKQGAEQ